MTDFTRRHLMAGTAAAAAAALIAPAQAAAPAIGKQAPNFYRYKLGSFEITAVSDGARSSPLPDTYVRNASKDDVNAALAALYLEKDKITIPFTMAVVNTGSKLIAIDTGLGEANFNQSKGAVGQYHSNLAAAGIDAKTIDTVIISHFHPDHTSGLVTADSKPAFPNAEIMVPAPEWAYWMDDGNMSRAPDAQKGTFANSRRVFDALGRKVTQYEAGKEITPGITSVATHGHTPGHMSHLISSGSSTMMLQADVTASVASLFVRNPGWHGPDQDAPLAEQTRRKLYDQLAADRMLVQGYHFPFPASGYLEKDGNGYRLVPAFWNPTI